MKLKFFKSGLMATTTFCSAALSAFAAVAIVSLVPTTVVAQDLTSGSLVGNVKLESGTPATGASVNIVGASTGYTATLVTDESGRFSLTQIPTGTYNIDISAADGSTLSSSAQVTLGSISSYDFTTTTATTVVVRGQARRNLDFDRTTTGSVLDVQQVATRLPVGRNIEALADLVPGISINDVFGPPSISGSSPAENIYYVNGMNVTNFRTFLGATTIPFDFYDQVEVKTGGYSAEFGRSTGGAFIATTRSGSNEFKGGLSYYVSPKGLSSKSPLSHVDLNGDPTYRQVNPVTDQESVAWLSGPIIKDHIYFFGFYNQRDLNTSYTDTYESDGSVLQDVRSNRSDPFYGGKLDFVLNPRHRLEYTHFIDDQTSTTTYNTDGVFTSTGGRTQVIKYTGKLTDWFTLTALYGKSSYNQTTQSDLDDEYAIYEDGAIIRGNPELLVEAGKDLRENYRIDGDFYFNLKGRHHVRVGFDREQLNADNLSFYSGGGYYRYYGAGTNCGSSGVISDKCVRYRVYETGGSFDVTNEAWYIQDSWDVTDRLNLNLGLRNETFTNFNAAGEVFLKMENQLAARIGVAYDVFGDKSTKLTAFYGRYHLPIAANTNIRLSGAELFTETYHTYTGRDATTLVPTGLSTALATNVYSDGSISDAKTLISGNLEPQYQDEYILGIERRFDSGWKFGATLMYRELSSVLEDSDIDYTDGCAYLASTGVVASTADCGSFGGGGYVLVNPGKDLVVTLNDTWGTADGTVVTIPASYLGFPQAKRTYQALAFNFERPWDGTWFLAGSVVLSRTIGNIEGGVKSDNAQSDTGLTQDFDEPGWTDGSYGLLPNHHGYSFKLRGSYQITERVLAGFNAGILSPRKYGCIGYYPHSDGRANINGLSAWYCNGELTPRGKSFDGDWINKLDISVSYTVPVPVGEVKFTVDVFNLFDTQGAEQYDEFGETGAASGTLSKSYGLPTSYQSPRYVRAGLKYEF